MEFAAPVGAAQVGAEMWRAWLADLETRRGFGALLC
jgi:hypothetical protein